MKLKSLSFEKKKTQIYKHEVDRKSWEHKIKKNQLQKKTLLYLNHKKKTYTYTVRLAPSIFAPSKFAFVRSAVCRYAEHRCAPQKQQSTKQASKNKINRTYISNQ